MQSPDYGMQSSSNFRHGGVMAERPAMSLHPSHAPPYDEPSLADANDVTLSQILGMSRDQKKQMLQVLFESIMDEDPNHASGPVQSDKKMEQPVQFQPPRKSPQGTISSSTSGYAQPLNSGGGYSQPLNGGGDYVQPINGGGVRTQPLSGGSGHAQHHDMSAFSMDRGSRSSSHKDLNDHFIEHARIPNHKKSQGLHTASAEELATVPELFSGSEIPSTYSCFQNMENAPMAPPPGLEDQIGRFNGGGLAASLSKQVVKGSPGPLKSSKSSVSEEERAGSKKVLSDSEVQGGAPKKVDLQSKYFRHRGPVSTFMIRNIPCRITQQQMMELIDEKGFQGKYDFLYLPSGTRPVKPGAQPEAQPQGISSSNLGYGFINLPNSEDAMMFQLTMQDYKFEGTCSNKLCAIFPAHIQGLDNNVKHFRRTAVKLTSFKPYIRTQNLKGSKKHSNGHVSATDISDAESFSSIGPYRMCKTDVSDNESIGLSLASLDSGVEGSISTSSSKKSDMLRHMQKFEMDLRVSDIFE